MKEKKGGDFMTAGALMVLLCTICFLIGYAVCYISYGEIYEAWDREFQDEDEEE